MLTSNKWHPGLLPYVEMIIGVDRSGDESNFPIVYVAVRLRDRALTDNVRKLVNKRDPRKGMRSEIKSTDLIDKELLYVCKHVHTADYRFKVLGSKEFNQFKQANSNKPKFERKLAYSCYRYALMPLLKPGDQVWLCKDLDEDSITFVRNRLAAEFNVDVRLSEHEGNVVIADWLAKAIRKGLNRKQETGHHRRTGPHSKVHSPMKLRRSL